MKWLLRIGGALVALIVLAIVVLKLMGMRTDAGRIRHTVEIDRPPAQVFRWLNEPERVKQWISWLVEIRPVQGAPTSGVGAKDVFVMDDPNMKQKVELESEVTAFEPDRKISVKIHAAMGFSGDLDYILTPVGEGRTRLEYDGRYQYHHWMASLFEPLVTPQAKAKLEGDLAKLKQLVEAEPRIGP
jgi:carbon monoxide dehydrogenase subunit G